MVSVDNRYLNSSNFVARRKVDMPFTASKANNEILKDQEPGYRVLDLTASTFNDAGTSYFHHSIGGYHGAKLQRYQDLIEHHIQPEMSSLTQVMKTDMNLSAIQEQLAHNQVLNMLNTRYIIFNPQAMPIRNLSAFGSVWPVDSIVWAASPNEEIDMLDQVDLRHSAVVNQEFRPLLSGIESNHTGQNQIEQTGYQPNKLNYKAMMESDGLVVFSEIWYTKGWKAFVNGEEKPLIRANYALRALVLPKGESTIEMRFEPRVWKPLARRFPLLHHCCFYCFLLERL